MKKDVRGDNLVFLAPVLAMTAEVPWNRRSHNQVNNFKELNNKLSTENDSSETPEGKTILPHCSREVPEALWSEQQPEPFHSLTRGFLIFSFTI